MFVLSYFDDRKYFESDIILYFNQSLTLSECKLMIRKQSQHKNLKDCHMNVLVPYYTR